MGGWLVVINQPAARDNNNNNSNNIDPTGQPPVIRQPTARGWL